MTKKRIKINVPGADLNLTAAMDESEIIKHGGKEWIPYRRQTVDYDPDPPYKKNIMEIIESGGRFTSTTDDGLILKYTNDHAPCVSAWRPQTTRRQYLQHLPTPAEEIAIIKSIVAVVGVRAIVSGTTSNGVAYMGRGRQPHHNYCRDFMWIAPEQSTKPEE